MEPEVESCGLEDIGFVELLKFCVVKLVPALGIAVLLWIGVVQMLMAVIKFLLPAGVVVKG